MKKITVIIPCAGKGTRLGLPFSKELFSIERNKCLIDYTFDLFTSYKREEVHFVVTINETKTDIIKYLSKYKHKFNISFTFLNPHESELPGSIWSAKHLFGEYNLVLLPDTIIQLKHGADIIDIVHKNLELTYLSFFYKNETSHEILKGGGALHVINNEVRDYEDKPQTNISRFNAHWCGLAFKQEAFDTFFNTFKCFYESGCNLPCIAETIIYKAKAIEVDSYSDLGTWENIYNFMQHS
jgi:NDP-sugar pyrophosphorylase family protein